MSLQLAKISSKGQVTIPATVRKALNVKAGDNLAWEIENDGRITVRRLEPIDLAYLSALNGTLSEWDSREDDEAYCDL
jgi:AbrB family looped-hinge helix DNA binding protein